MIAFKTASIRPTSTRSVTVSLANILARTPSLGALRIRVAESCGPNSAWARTSLVRTEGIPIGPALHNAFLRHPVSFPLLKKLELDVFSDIAPLLRVVPNLEDLRLYMSSGFVQPTNAEIVAALRHVPHLRRLVYSPASLRITSVIEEAEAAVSQEPNVQFEEKDYSAELLIAIGKRLPKLEVLDLRARCHSEDIHFVSSDAPITPEVSYLPCCSGVDC